MCSDLELSFRSKVKVIAELYEKSLSEAYLSPFGPIWLILHVQCANDKGFAVTLNDVCLSSVKVILDHAKFIHTLSNWPYLAPTSH